MTDHKFLPVETTIVGTLRLTDPERSDYVVVPISWVNEVNAFIFAARAAEMRPDHPGLLAAKAEDNKAHAGERFPDLRQCLRADCHCDGWEDSDGYAVVFTPHGYRRRVDLEADLSDAPPIQ